MSDAILIIGGYGTVGEVVATALAKHHENQIILAGRNTARAAELASALGEGVRWRLLDISKPLDYDQVFADVRYVVMCLDLPNLEFARQCFQRGIHYVDISAEYPILAAITELDAIARQNKATAVLSVGLVPGLSNLMARHSLRYVEPINHLDIALVAGLGEKHGTAASLWILNHLSDEAGMTRFQFHEPYNQKTVHRFAFSDQYTLPRTLPIGEAATWLGFNSFLMTHLITLARLPILRRLFQQRFIKQLLLHITQQLQFGSDAFVLTAHASNASSIYQAWLRGNREALATGLVTAEVVHQMTFQQFSEGVYHIEQLFQLEDFLPLLKQHGMVFSDQHTWKAPTNPTE